ncbi:hypothetical protein [Aeoliella sp.]|uniref:hypothetical protein n=1 Tax=Aeoliella sp. TaxID=2795800 RepID=UPI003CCC448C
MTFAPFCKEMCQVLSVQIECRVLSAVNRDAMVCNCAGTHIDVRILAAGVRRLCD